MPTGAGARRPDRDRDQTGPEPGPPPADSYRGVASLEVADKLTDRHGLQIQIQRRQVRHLGPCVVQR